MLVDHRAACVISSVDSNCNFSRDKGTVYRKKVSGFLRRRAEDSWRRGSAPSLRARRFRSLKDRGVRHFENQVVVSADSIFDMRSLVKKTRQIRCTIENVAQGLPGVCQSSFWRERKYSSRIRAMGRWDQNESIRNVYSKRAAGSLQGDGMSQQREYGDDPSKLRPSIRDHRDMIQGIQEKNAEELKRHNTISRSRAKSRYEQKIRRTAAGRPLQDDMLVSGKATLQKHDSILTEKKEARREQDSFGGSTGVFVPSTKKVVETKKESHGDKPKRSRDSRTTVTPRVKREAMAATSLSDDESGGAFDEIIDDDAIKKFYHNQPPKDVHVVDDLAEAKRVAAILMEEEMQGRTFACDTEVMGIDVTRESPCCHGVVTCFSIYCGSDVDFSQGSVTGEKKTMLWVDTWLNGEDERAEEAMDIMNTFKPFFESNSHKKVWHNYSFDRHVMERMGVKCNGFYGDTMHMARLWDSSRTGRGGYSLEALTSTYILDHFVHIGRYNARYLNDCCS